VLVVEDDFAIRSLIKFLVQREKWTVDEVSDGTEALGRIHNNRYDAIVLDLMLPGVPGDEILAELRRIAPSEMCRTIVVTASPGFAKKIDTTGVAAVLTKPFDIDNLVDVLRRCPPRDGQQ
jgi:DNA-binding response OmpR family regulator